MHFVFMSSDAAGMTSWKPMELACFLCKSVIAQPGVSVHSELCRFDATPNSKLSSLQLVDVPAEDSRGSMIEKRLFHEQCPVLT